MNTFLSTLTVVERLIYKAVPGSLPAQDCGETE